MNVLITGTSKGLGYGLARYYLEQGHTVFGISRHKNADLENENFYFLPQDVRNFNEVEQQLPLLLKKVKTIDLVVLNAGKLNEIKDLRDTPLEEIQHTMDINVWANKIIIDLLFRTIPEIKQVVGISSGASVSGARGWNTYSLLKATLNMLIGLPIWVGVVLGARSYPPWKTLKRRRDAECNHYPHAYLYWRHRAF